MEDNEEQIDYETGGPYEISAGGSTTNTTKNQSLWPQVSVSTSSSTSHVIVGDTEQSVVNKMGSQNQRTQIEILKTQMEKMTTQLQNLAQLNETLEELQTQYASPISVQRVNKGKDMEVPLL